MTTIDPRNPPEYIYRVPACYRRPRRPVVPRVSPHAPPPPAVHTRPAVHTPEAQWEPATFWEQAALFIALGAGFLAFLGVTYLLFGV